MQTMQERVCMELDIPSPSVFHSSLPSLIPELAMVCTLDNNLQLCGAMGTPRKLRHFSEADPPEDLDEKFYFEDVTTDDAKKSYSFTLHSKFPLTPASYTSTVAYFDYEFVFPVGSSGTYCFLPLTEFLGTISYSSSDSGATADFVIQISYLIKQNGEALGGDWGYYGTNLHCGDQILLSLSTPDFNYDRSIVDLDSEHLISEISVLFQLGFYNNYNDDGHFILDCSSQGGKIACDHVKWGKRRPERLPEFGPQS